MTNRERAAIPVSEAGTVGHMRVTATFRDFKAACEALGFETNTWELHIIAGHVRDGKHVPRRIEIRFKASRNVVTLARRRPPNALERGNDYARYGYDYGVACGLMLRALIVMNDYEQMRIARQDMQL